MFSLHVTLGIYAERLFFTTKMKSFLTTTLLSIGLADAQSTWKVGQSVKTTSGVVTGQASSWKNEVSEYLGVPFAEPPVGPLRWQAPKAYNRPNDVVNATKYVSFFRGGDQMMFLTKQMS